jgi:hypothetical protein
MIVAKGLEVWLGGDEGFQGNLNLVRTCCNQVRLGENSGGKRDTNFGVK